MDSSNVDSNDPGITSRDTCIAQGCLMYPSSTSFRLRMFRHRPLAFQGGVETQFKGEERCQ
jgi:hypothetical protein